MQIEGENAHDIFKNESGGHRWQRIPPTEVKGRVHTSTITVAVLDLKENQDLIILDSDIDIITTKGSGPGGQHRNKVESCVVVTHRPSGLVVRSESERSQYQNKITALSILKTKLRVVEENGRKNQENNIRKNQIGSGERGDKIRTYRVRDDRIIDHKSGRKVSLKQWQKGKIIF